MSLLTDFKSRCKNQIKKVFWKGVIFPRFIIFFNVSLNFPLLFGFQFLLRPTLVGEELYSQLRFFDQSIFAHLYIHRIRLWLVSLESLQANNFKFKRVFWISIFPRSYGVLMKCERVCCFVDFFHDFWRNFHQNLLNNMPFLTLVSLVLCLKIILGKRILIVFWICHFWINFCIFHSS